MQTAQAKPFLLSPRYPGDHILQRAPKPVEPPDHQRVLSAQDLLERGAPGPLGHRATHPVHNDARAARVASGLLLEIQVLILRHMQAPSKP